MTVITYNYAYPNYLGRIGQVTLCGGCEESHTRALGSVFHGAHEGSCDKCDVEIGAAHIVKQEHGLIHAEVSSSVGDLGICVCPRESDGVLDIPQSQSLDAWADDALQAVLEGMSDYDRDVFVGGCVAAVKAAKNIVWDWTQSMY